MIEPLPLAFEVPNSKVEIAADISGTDLVIVINGRHGCMGRIVIEDLCAHNQRHVRIGEHRLMREPSR